MLLVKDKSSKTVCFLWLIFSCYATLFCNCIEKEKQAKGKITHIAKIDIFLILGFNAIKKEVKKLVEVLNKGRCLSGVVYGQIDCGSKPGSIVRNSIDRFGGRPLFFRPIQTHTINAVKDGEKVKEIVLF